MSAVGAGHYSIRIPEKSVLQYETSLNAGNVMLLAHSTADELTRAPKRFLLRQVRIEHACTWSKGPIAATVQLWAAARDSWLVRVWSGNGPQLLRRQRCGYKQHDRL
jgi:hypothetical protein